MKTYQIAKSLRILADILESQPNIELSKDTNMFSDKSVRSTEVAVSLQTLLKLSKFSKKDWVSLIKEYNFDIDINNRYSSRDIIGKLLNYLDANPAAIDFMKKKSMKERQNESPLMRALDLLVRGDENE